MKKVGIIGALALSSLLAFSGSPESAKAATVDVLEPVTQDQIVVPMGAGTWDPWFGNPDEKDVTPGYWRTFNTVYSGGGDYKVRVNVNDTGGPLTLKLYEDDGTSATLIKTINLAAGQEYVFTGISNYVDGDNGTAELFVNVYSSGSRAGMVSLSYWD